MGITQKGTDYYLVFYSDSHSALRRFVEVIELSPDIDIRFISYDKFDEIKEIGSGGYGTVYTTTCKDLNHLLKQDGCVALKRFKNLDRRPELFVSEVIFFVILFP